MKRSVNFQPQALAELEDWLNTDRKVAQKILALTPDILRSPFTGIGKPEPLRGDLAGYWSRRITDEHR